MSIDARFFLLKGTYEERIFHTVMQRDQWFQILMGERRKQLGRLPADDDGEGGAADASLLAEAQDEADRGVGQLTEKEKRAVMLDLRPTR
jgi:hypothetical protein